MVPQRRLVWLRCEGVPLNLWSKTCFESLVSRFGELVSLDERSSSLEKIDVARLCVRTSRLEPILSTLQVRLNKRLYRIRMFEKVASFEGARCRCSCPTMKT